VGQQALCSEASTVCHNRIASAVYVSLGPILLKKSDFCSPQKLRRAGKKCPTMLQTCRNANVSVMEYVGRRL